MGFDAHGEPLVTVEGSGGQPQRAETTVSLRPSFVGARVVLVLGEKGERVITGVVRSASAADLALSPEVPRELVLDGERLVFSAEREIVLRCGPSSITLTREGKVIVRGANVLQVSSGLHRIQGAAVEIN